jgi:pimeloyl-ACP methyl ester carboxylesterase
MSNLSMKPILILLLGVLPFSNLDAQQYQIGFANRTFTDQSRDREIPVAVYYPSINGGEEASVAASAVGFPVISFGHGFVIETESYSWLWEALVPQGYIVIFPQTEGQLLPAPDHAAFGEDIAFCAKELLRLGGLSTGPLSGKVLPRVAYMGHSMGGGAAYLGAEATEGVLSTTITFAAAQTNPSAIAAAASTLVPSLVIAAAEDCVTPIASNQDPIFDNLPASQKAIVRIAGASHCNFTDGSASLCFLGESFSCFGFGPFISRVAQQQRTLDVLLPWLENFLKSQCEAGEELQAVLASGASNGSWDFELEGASALQCPASCEVPFGLSSEGSPEAGFQLQWEEVPYALGYQCGVRAVGVGSAVTELTAIASFQTPSLSSSLNYEFRARAFCPGFGFGSWSAWQEINAAQTAEVILLNAQPEALIISQKHGRSQGAVVQVFTMDGRLVFESDTWIPEADMGKTQFDLNHLPIGLYVVVVVGDERGISRIKIGLN